MTHVVTENCIKCKHTDCVDVCPVDCFRETPYMLVIDPDECIDCAVCIHECPSNAIFAEEDVPVGQEQFIQFNSIMTPQGDSITRSKKPLPDADFWNGVSGKAALLATESVDPEPSTSLSKHTQYFHLFGAAELSDNEWAENLNNPDPTVRYLLASRKDFFLDSDRLSRGLRDEDTHVRKLYIRLGGNNLQQSDIELLLNDPEKSIRLAILNLPTVSLTDNQFFKSLDSVDREEIYAALKKITAERATQLLTHPSALLRSFAYGSELADLSSAQIEIGLNDSEFEVRNAIIRRADFSPSPTQFLKLLTENSDGYRMFEICRNVSDECIERVMSDANPSIISKLIVKTTLLTNEHKIRALSMGDEELSLTVLNDFGKKITKTAVEIALRSDSVGVRLRAIELRGVNRLTEQQIAQCLADSSDSIRSIIVRFAALSAEQKDNAFTDSSELVRLALVRRKDFIPSVKQLKCGLKDKCDEVRQGFSERFQLSEGKVTSIASRGISRVLNELAGIPTWTKEKYQLQSELLKLIDELDYFQFTADARDATFTRFGEHGIIDVPTNQRGSLMDMRGKKIHLICLGSGRYSTIIFAAKPIDHVN